MTDTNIHQPFLDILDKDYQKQLDKGMKIKATNPYSGESAMLSEEEFALYHLIKHAEETEQYDAMQKGLSKFSRMNAAAYMTLLD